MNRTVSCAALAMLVLCAPVAVPADPAVTVEREPPHRRVALQPLGTLDPSLVAAARDAIAEAFDVAVEVLPPRPLPRAALATSRQRYRAEALLDALDHAAPSRFDNVIGLTAADIATPTERSPEWGVIGLAAQGERPCIVSTFRMGRGAARSRLTERLEKVVRHELAHAFGLPHCPVPHCLMNDARGTTRTVDAETGLCPRCRARLEQVGSPARSPG